MENLEQIKTKLRKLQKLYDSAKKINSEGEAQAAAAAIQRLLTQYNLSMSELGVEEENNGITEHPCSGYTYKSIGGYWEYRLAYVLCKYNFCKCFMRGTYKNLLIVGSKENIEMVNWLRSMLADRFVEFSKKRFKEYQETIDFALRPISKDKYQRSYLMGVVEGLEQKLRSEQEQDRKNAEYGAKVNALIVRTDTAVMEYMNKKYTMGKGKSIRVNYDAARCSGIVDGRNTQLYKPIAEASRRAANDVKLLG